MNLINLNRILMCFFLASGLKLNLCESKVLVLESILKRLKALQILFVMNPVNLLSLISVFLLVLI